MKKFVVSIVLICYLAVSSGVIINFHYCMNKLASTEFFASATKECPKCGMHIETSHGCCRDEVQVVKMDDDQKISTAFSFELPLLEAPVVKPSAFIVASFYTISGTKHFLNHSPPLLSSQDTYLQNSVFRIWDQKKMTNASWPMTKKKSLRQWGFACLLCRHLLVSIEFSKSQIFKHSN